jgi:ferrous iron transport protein A
MNRAPLQRLVPLCQLPPGTAARVHALKGEPEFCQRAREMGFGESAPVTKIGGTGPFVCQINGTRVALGHTVAMQIIVAMQIFA